MSTLLCCDNCDKLFDESELEVSFPDIPDLLERIEPGEPVPYGECIECGCLVHKAEPIPGKRVFVSVVGGKFEITLDGDGKSFSEREPDCITDDPKVAREFLVRARVDSVMCSSSLDFPDDYGMDPVKVEQLFSSR